MIGRGIRSSIGARKRKKDVLSKICVVCNRPFNWRKKWEKVTFFYVFYVFFKRWKKNVQKLAYRYGMK